MSELSQSTSRASKDAQWHTTPGCAESGPNSALRQPLTYAHAPLTRISRHVGRPQPPQALERSRAGMHDRSILRAQVNAFKNDADTAISESDSAFQARVNRAPRPSSS